MKYFLLILIFLLNFKAEAQVSEGDDLDKIVAIVGKEIIMKSDIDGYLIAMKQQNPQMNIDDEDIRQRVLDGLINEKLVVMKAEEDSVEITEQEVNQRVDYMIKSYVQQFGSEKRLEDVMGMSVTQLRREYRDVFREKMLVEKMKQIKFSNVQVSPSEIKEFYESYRDSLPEIPNQVELYHIVFEIRAKANAKDDVYNLARKVRDSIINGGDFGEFAKKYSGDQFSKNNGGELGWISRGKLYEDFEKAAFALQKDQISLPVETPFGFHIIETLDKRGDSIKTRHILFKIGQTNEDRELAKKRLLELKEQAEEENNFEELAKKYSDDRETKGFGGLIGKTSLDELPANLRNVVSKLPEGGISDPMPYNADPTKPAYHIIYKKRVIPAHRPSLEDDFDQIKTFAINNKQSQLYEKWLDKLREEMYWEIK